VSASPAGARDEGVRRAVVPVFRSLGRRPWLLPAALSGVLRLARPGWWRRWPPLPLPDPELWRFRMQTAYGGTGDAVPDEDDVVSFVEWSRAMRHWRRN